MKANKIIINDEVLIDLTSDTATESDVASGKTFHKADGNIAVGTAISSDGLSINGIVREYEILAGENVSAGDFVEFVAKWAAGEYYTGKVSSLSACRLDNNRVLVVCGDGYAMVLTLGGVNIHVGTPKYFVDTSISGIPSVCALSDSKAVVTYSDNSSGSKSLYSAVLTITGTAITVGSQIKFGYHGSLHSSCTLTDSKVLTLDYYGSYATEHVDTSVLTVDGTTITRGNSIEVYDGKASYCSVCKLTDSKAVAIIGSSAYVLSIDGTKISVGSRTALSSTVKHPSVCRLTDGKALIAYHGDTNVCANILTISGTTITKGTETVIKEGAATYISVAALTEDKALVSYDGSAIILSIDDTVINAGTPTAFNASGGSKITLPFSTNSALIVYADGTGKYASLSIDGTTITIDAASGTYVRPATSNLHNVGVAKTAGTEGETIEVFCAV